jgi:hypothetical protein
MFVDVCREYAEAHTLRDDLGVEERQLRTKINAADERLNAIRRKLGAYVGNSIRTRNAVVGGMLLRIEYAGDDYGGGIEVVFEPVTQDVGGG